MNTTTPGEFEPGNNRSILTLPRVSELEPYHQMQCHTKDIPLGMDLTPCKAGYNQSHQKDIPFYLDDSK